MTPAPLIIFTYKRMDTLRKLVKSLLANPIVSETELYIFSDGPKNAQDFEQVAGVRKYIKTIKGFKQVKYFFSAQNTGLAASIISGVSDIFQLADKAIVLEDDLVVTPNFLVFMNQALLRYQSDKKVFSISGYSFNLGSHDYLNEDGYFLNRGWSWGWATWKDRWKDVDWAVSDYTKFSKSKILKADFNKGGSDLTAMLKKQMAGKLDSWAIRWFYAQFKNGGLTLYPTKSKIFNNGFDDSATHTTGSITRYIPLLDDGFKTSFFFPDDVVITPLFQLAFQKKMGFKSRIKSKLDSLKLRLFRSFKWNK